MGKYILIISTSLLTAMAMAASPYDTFGITHLLDRGCIAS